jgi:ADP-ribosylglycohydrolase
MLFALAIAQAVQTGPAPEHLCQDMVTWAKDLLVSAPLLKVIHQAASVPPADYVQQQGWVLIAMQNAVYQLLHAPTLEEGVVQTIMAGGDTDTNAAICGALLGAVHGRAAMPAQWENCLLVCRPQQGLPHVLHPRPECFWPVDALDLAARLTLER